TTPTSTETAETAKSTTTTTAPEGPKTPPVAAAPPDAAAPKRKPPAGLGNAIGRVLYNSQAAPGIEVELCENLSFISGCSGRTYEAKTNKDGYYVIDKVKPGDYALSVRVFNTNRYIYPTAGILSAAKFKVEKDKTLDVRTVNLWKTNLQVTSPKPGSTIKTGQPKLMWKAYPGAAQYEVTLRSKDNATSMDTMKTSETSATPDKALLNGEFKWKVEAYNAEGVKIATTPEDATFKVVGQAGSANVVLVAPTNSARISGTGVTLKWKAHPQADEYRVYVKGVKAADALLKFESVDGTSYTFTQPLPPDTYYWSAHAYKAGDKIAESTLQHFTVK
ncbi:MAG: carboxypeptidase-like regulatory domain-containing protein, partial [Armatimonadota bacterium]|nr:carboxypeptidase-like regulatory domain-containing protein [Armatimonadota bacterium]